MSRLKQPRNEIWEAKWKGRRYVGINTSSLSIGATKLGTMKTAQGRLNRLQRDLAVLIKREERRLRREKK